MKEFILSEKNKERNGMLWNAAYGMILAFQSVILLMVIKRACGLAAAGVFGIANSIANLMFTIGRFGMRNYQVSDVNHDYSFSDYFWSRIASCTLMIIVSIFYSVAGIFTSGYTTDKVIVILICCMLKVIEAFEDVYGGYYQSIGRLDVAGKLSSIRLTIGIVVMMIVLIASQNLMLSLIVSFVISVAVSLWFLKITYEPMREYESVNAHVIDCTNQNSGIEKVDVKKVSKLLFNVLPLFVGLYLSLYIDNIGKYAIDRYMNEEAQACYNFIFMPVFVISLLAGFIFAPLVGKISDMWNESRIREFLVTAGKQLLVIVGISVVVLLGAYILGIPVLSIIYATDLTEYKSELMVLLLGGMFYAIGAFFVLLLTVMRRQGAVIVGYLITSVLSKCFSTYAVTKYGIMGASLLYTATMVIGVISFLVFIVVYIKNSEQS